MNEKKIYDKMKSDTKEQFKSWKESRNGDLKNNYVTFLEMLFRLKQICNYTQLLCKRQINQINGIDNKKEIRNLNNFKISSKIEALVEFLNQNNNDNKSVVFSQ
ncbi:hypothetical protein RhiirA5_437039 [Rhizophagus irregularis]|uniref:Uncharacterized protein n=1 Tax=Rhizophagus irregularis TaxID=588596 RepID=A0A2I1EUS3_9GLOM|nr:hypothetical protein RhiirA5_437039 [Rhizophagus irregularis]PKC69655.1 hypothetical protein RhiirA1_455764 [Rhizophagus irregularis]PKY25877.1 hypothetical protein RhiirB3_440994 [Rhizophagus irregularis]CAB4489130.1 unnamed protein product [Rhizophagus irregularis]CAB5112288.1 unnamed protein product [Rhizophagus irregularis]